MFKRNTDIDRRVRRLKQGRRGEGPVMYWMSRDQRVADNWALLWAQQEALSRGHRLEVVFCYDPKRDISTKRHDNFLIAGLGEIPSRLRQFNVGFRLLVGRPDKMLPRLLADIDAHLLVTDFDPLREKRNLLQHLVKDVVPPVFEVDAHNVIPAWLVTDKKEYAAYTIRPKINRLLGDFLGDYPELMRHPYSPGGDCQRQKPDFSSLIDLGAAGPAVVANVIPGEKEAVRAMEKAIADRLTVYDEKRNDPLADGQSGLSPYLHFGHLAPQRLALEIQKSTLSVQVKDAFLEELIVRRELADNFCLYEPNYDRFEGFPNWAQKTLNEHRGDKRRNVYNLEQFEHGSTHEDLWNSCQIDLVKTGKLHGYLRMYWAKKILEWTSAPEEALAYAIRLNDRYSLDGNDPNGYTGVAWSIGGVHDRAWPERPVFGKIRFMNEAGCRRKFNVQRYIEKNQ